MSALHVETLGSGPPLLLIHGWGMHGGMWGQVAEKLSASFTVHSIDLPGHGYSNLATRFGANKLDEIVLQLSSQFSEPLTLCGWSLGGQIALRWAQLQPKQIQKLILVATTPCFVQKENWACAMAAATLQEFASSLQQNHTQTLRRFLALQVRGSEQERELLVDLRTQLFNRGEPDIAALQGGLEILRDTDLRTSLPQVLPPTLLLAGERDTLTPLAAMQYMKDKMHNSQLVSIKGAAHSPFLSHPQIFTQHILSFLHE